MNEQNLTGIYGIDTRELTKILRDNGINYIRVRLWVDPKDQNGKERISITIISIINISIITL